MATTATHSPFRYAVFWYHEVAPGLRCNFDSLTQAREYVRQHGGDASQLVWDRKEERWLKL